MRDVASVESVLLRERADAALDAGVRIREPERLSIRGELHCGAGVEIDANVIIVSATQRSARGTRLVGCYLADRDAVRGAALAVLNATNRVLGNYISTR